MQEKPFWEQLYADMEVSAFSKGPTMDVNEFCNVFPQNAQVLDVGCGEGRNSIFMAKLGNKVMHLTFLKMALKRQKRFPGKWVLRSIIFAVI